MSKNEEKRPMTPPTDSDASASNSDKKRQRSESPKYDGSGPSNSSGTQVYGGQANKTDPFAAFRREFLNFVPGGVGAISSNGAGGVGGVGTSSSNGAGGVGGFAGGAEGLFSGNGGVAGALNGVGGSSSNGPGGVGGVGGSSSNGAGGVGGFAGGAEGLLSGNGGVAGALNGNGGAGGGGFSRRNLAPPPTIREPKFRGPVFNPVLSSDSRLMMQIIASGIRSGEVTPPKANNSLETAPATAAETPTATAQSPAPAPSSPGADEVGEAKQGPAPS